MLIVEVTRYYQRKCQTQRKGGIWAQDTRCNTTQAQSTFDEKNFSDCNLTVWSLNLWIQSCFAGLAKEFDVAEYGEVTMRFS